MDAHSRREETSRLGSLRGVRVPHAGAAIAILLLGLLLRLETLHQRPLWWDERVTHRISTGDQHPEEDIEHPALHPLIVSLLVEFTHPTTAVRLPSTMFGVASIGLLIWVGREVFSLPVGLLSGFMLATSIYHVNYSQDGRAYSLLVMLTLAQYLLLLAFFRRRRAAHLVGYVLLGSLSVWAHHIGILVQAQLLITALGWAATDLRHARRVDTMPPFGVRLLIPVAVSMAAIALAYLPQAQRTFQWVGGMQEGVDRFRLAPSLRFFHELFARWGVGSGWPLYISEMFLLLGLILLLRGGKPAMVVLPWFCAPFVLFAVVPFSHFFDIRYLITALPAFYLIVSLGAARSSEAVRSWLKRIGTNDMMAARLATVVLICPVLIFGSGNGLNYLTFRKTTVRCSEFFERPEVLDMYDRFCRDHVLLNSLIAEDRYILSPVDK